MKTKSLMNGKAILTVFALLVGLYACNSDKISKESLYTFTDQMVGEYLADPENADDYSEFVKLLDTTKVLGLLEAYGEYTCFAPTNDAL